MVACTEPTELIMNVRAHEGGVNVMVRELNRACTCSIGEWPSPGDCATTSDAISCDCEPSPGNCVDQLRLRRNGEVIITNDFDARDGGQGSLAVAIADGDVVEVVGCGGVASIPLGALPTPPVPEVSGQMNGSDLEVSWTTTPPSATVLAAVSDGFGGRWCHYNGDAGTSTFNAEGVLRELRISVFGLATMVEHDTELGAAHVWRGALSSLRVDPLSR